MTTNSWNDLCILSSVCVAVSARLPHPDILSHVTLRLWCVVEMSISSSTMLSMLEVGLHWILSSSCLCSLSATIWMASVHSSLSARHTTSGESISVYRVPPDKQCSFIKAQDPLHAFHENHKSLISVLLLLLPQCVD